MTFGFNLQALAPKDRTQLVILAASVGLLAVVTAMNAAVDLGALMHDLFCPEHGRWT